jgi:hypothetical protein
MNEIFSQFQHRFIEWINDSSANIVFRSKESAKKALESLSYPKARDPPWRRTPDILVNDDCPPIFLQMRLATAADVKKGKKSAPTVFKGDSKVANRARASQRAGQGNVYRDGMTTELLVQAGLLGKRGNPEPPSAEEVAQRQKRAARFGGTEETAMGTSTTTGDAGTSTTTADTETALSDALSTELGRRRKPLPPPSEEEAAKRQKRSERFVDGSGAIATSGMAAGGGKAATSETAACGDTTANGGTAASGDTQKAAAAAMK